MFLNQDRTVYNITQCHPREERNVYDEK